MTSASDEEIAGADFILSILPPGEALALAQHLAPVTDREQRKAGLCRLQRHQSGDRRAASPQRSRPPAVRLSMPGSSVPRRRKAGTPGPRFYASGTAAPRFAALREYGLDVRVLDGPLSAASALKMSYAGITKGTQAIGAAMMLAATRGGSAEALLKELEFSQKDLLAHVQAAITDDAGESLPLDRGDAGDRRLRRRRSRRARALPGRRAFLRTHRRGFHRGKKGRRGTLRISGKGSDRRFAFRRNSWSAGLVRR